MYGTSWFNVRGVQIEKEVRSYSKREKIFVSAIGFENKLGRSVDRTFKKIIEGNFKTFITIREILCWLAIFE